jgi:hypothetical protein
LIAKGKINLRLEPEGIRVFKSTMEPFSHRNARPWFPMHGTEVPTIWLWGVNGPSSAAAITVQMTQITRHTVSPEVSVAKIQR